MNFLSLKSNVNTFTGIKRPNQKNGQQELSGKLPFGATLPSALTPSNPNDVFTSKENIDDALDLLFGTQKTPEKPKRRLNDTDSNILEESADKSLNDNPFRVELKIGKTENELQKIKEKIELFKILDLDLNKQQYQEYQEKEKALQKQLDTEKQEYKNLGLSYRITMVFSEVYVKSKEIILTAREKTNDACEKLLPPLRKNDNINSELKKFDILQKNIFEITSKKSNPFGENENNLQNLVAYINRANQVSRNLSKQVNENMFINFGSKLKSFTGSLAEKTNEKLNYFRTFLPLKKAD